MSRESAARLWPPIARFITFEARLGAAACDRGPVVTGFYEFLRFGCKQAWACLFGGAMLVLLIVTRVAYPAHAPLTRYDFLFLAALSLQATLLATRLETFEEAKIIFVFHVIGTLMEVQKTAVGSWIYPETSLFHIGGVPLFTGFMYASVGSYIARAWRLFDFRFTAHPPLRSLLALSAAIYANFWIDHYGIDIRLILIAATIILFRRTLVHFKVWTTYRFMPLLIGFALVALFIWIGENIGTFTGTWLYPRQMAHWTMVPTTKLSSWFLLMIISYALVASINGVQHHDESGKISR